MLDLRILAVDGRKVWHMFAPHHYLSTKYAGHRAWLAVLPDGTPVAFTSIIRFPHGSFSNGWRGHRTVVLPDFQGLGIGPRLDDWRAEHVRQVLNGRFFARTSHPRLGAYRDASPYWRATSTNGKRQSEAAAAVQLANKNWKTDSVRVCYSHEYIGRM